MSVKIGKGVKIYPKVKIGKNSVIGDFVILGIKGRNSIDSYKLDIGENATIRAFTVIYTGNKIGNDFQTGQGASIRENNIIKDNVSIGTNAVLEYENFIDSGSRIHSNCFLEMTTIGKNVFVGPGVVFLDDPHPMKCPKYKECKGGAKVEDFAKIGGRSVLLPGVIVGKHSLIGAGSCVTRNIPENRVAVGYPAQVVKKISDLQCYIGAFDQPYEWEPYV
ncbi:MAG: DapH/DapD/GlmU-related protein [bacterium]|nr:DapH/DapD/GlmU-related protein [bacterium]